MSNMNHLTPHMITTNFIDPMYERLSLTKQAELLGISRGSLYYKPVPVDPQTLFLMNRVDKIHTDWPVYGARKIAKQIIKDNKKEREVAMKKGLIVPEEIIIGRKRVRTLMREMGIEAIYQKPHLSRNNKPHPVYPYLLQGVTASFPNHIWGADITYIKMHGGFLYLVAFLDWYSRFVVGWKLSTTLETGFVLEAANEALEIGIPEITNVDQGVQFTSEDFIGLWNPERTKISMDHRGRCFDNIFTERLWRGFKYEEVYVKDYMTIMEARNSIDTYFQKYNYERLHEALGYKTPAEYYFVN